MSEKRVFAKLEPISKKTRVIAHLRDAILSGAIRPGEQIVEGKVAQEFGVGQGLIREALIELEHQGFVQRTPFSSTQVTTFSLEDAQQIFDVRIQLEPMAIELAAKNASAEEIAELWEMTTEAKRAAEAGDTDTFMEGLLECRRKIWRLSGNKYLEETLERLVVPLYVLYVIRGGRSEGRSDDLSDPATHQEDVVKALQAGDVEGAKRAAREFLERRRNGLGSELVPPAS